MPNRKELLEKLEDAKQRARGKVVHSIFVTGRKKISGSNTDKFISIDGKVYIEGTNEKKQKKPPKCCERLALETCPYRP